MPYTALRQRPTSSGGLRQRVWRATHILVLILAPVILLSLTAAGIGYVRLLHGPVSLKAFGDSIEQSINAQLDGFTTDIDDAVLTLAEDYTVELRLINLRVKERDGDLVASAPTAAVELNKSALWRLEAAPERVYLIEPSLTVAYSEAQGFQLSIADASHHGSEPPASIVPPRPVPARPPGSTAQPSFHRIDIARILAESSARARTESARASPIREIGVRNATVTLTYKDKMSQIRVPEASIGLEHMKRRSIISGHATIESGERPWTVSFRTDETTKGSSLKVTTTVRDLVPSTLAKVAPGLDLLGMLSTPLNGELALDLTSAGDLKTADLHLDLGHGFIGLPSLAETPILIDGGHLALNYDADTRRLNLTPSKLNWGQSHVTLEGAVLGQAGPQGEQQWHFGLQSTAGVLEADEFGVPPIPIDSFRATGRLIPAEGLIQLAEFSLKAGGGEVTANGEVITGQETPSTRLEAALSPMPVSTLKALWPRAAAPTARSWVGTQVERASLKSASLKLLSGRFLESAEDGNAAPGGRVSARMDVADLRMHPLPESLPIEAPEAIIRLENSTLEVVIPQAAIVASETTRLPLSGGRFTVVDFSNDAPIAELALKSQASLAALVDTLNHSQLHLAGQGPLPLDGINGKVDGEIKIAMPLVSGGGIVSAEGKARITDVKGRSKEHKLDLQGGTIDITVADGGVIAKGDMIVNSVPTKIHMHRIFDALPEMQPPIRITAKLDNSDRTQLGFDVNHMVQGNVPVEVTVTQKTDAPLAIHVQADLTDAELMLSEVAWRKAPGRTASLSFDVDASDAKNLELTNFRVIGDNIAVDGWMKIDAKREVSEFSFPNFSINVVSRLAVSGKIGANGIWKTNVKGSTFDAKDVFRSLLAFNASETAIKPLRPAKGVDLTAEIGTLIGHSDVSLRDYKATITERGGRIVGIDATGVLDGGKILVVQMKPDGGRKLTAETADAGQAFKLVGFYPNLQGGRLTLEVELEGRGAAEMSGKLWVDNFLVLGDPIISEVYLSAEGGPDAGTRKRRIEREVFEFTRLTAPFSIGHGQFVLDDSYIRGPLLGASIRGKADYNSRRLSLGGTYVPLQGINSAVCDIPLVGPIVAGFDCQGVFGITYAIQGPMAQPQVLVNPLSMFTPGILRVIMEMTNPNPKVQPMRGSDARPTEKRARASAGNDVPSSIDGWSSETTPASKKK